MGGHSKSLSSRELRFRYNLHYWRSLITHVPPFSLIMWKTVWSGRFKAFLSPFGVYSCVPSVVTVAVAWSTPTSIFLFGQLKRMASAALNAFLKRSYSALLMDGQILRRASASCFS